MLPQTSYDQAASALAKLLNQDAIPTSESGRVTFFIAAGVQRILRAYDFTQTLTYSSVTTDTNGRVSLAALPLGMAPGFESVTDGTHDYGQDFTDARYHYHQGEYKYNVVVENGVWVLYSSEPNANITIGYYSTPDTITANVKIAFQPMVIAKAALIYYRQAQDPEADTEQEEDQFRQEIAELSEAQERRRPQRFAETPRDSFNHHIGGTGYGRGGYYGGRLR